MPQRRGSVLLIVLVVVLMLSLGAYTFSDLMVMETESAVMYGRAAQSRAFADSGIELAAAVLGEPDSADAPNLYNNAELFQGVVMQEAEVERGRGRFSIVTAIENDPQGTGVRYGLIDESGRLNINAIAAFKLEEDESRNFLMSLPNMTFEIADAILDFVDTDSTMREFGAETDYYESMSPPYSAKNGPLDSIDELLLVAGVTPELLFGEDGNRNGLLDANENDAEQSPPFDNADGLLNPGWSAFLTVHSREKNVRSDGTPRIDLNNSQLTDLYDQLELEFGEEVAKFVVAYRMNGPVENEQNQGSGGPGTGSRQRRNANSGVGTGSNPNGNSGVGTGGNSGVGTGGNLSSGGSTRGTSSGNSLSVGTGQSLSGSDRDQAQQAASAVAKSMFGAEGQVTRGGLDLSTAASHDIASIYDLIGVEVKAKVNGTDTPLVSPWPADTGAMQDYLPLIVDGLTAQSGEFIEGRININQARREVLLGIPGMNPETAEAIANWSSSGAGEVRDSLTGARATTGWLLTEGLVPLEEMRLLDKYLTTHGSVFRVGAVGYFDAGGPVTRLEAVIDATETPPKVVFFHDLSELGPGYTRAQLLGQ